ncbi:histone acetyltransferase YNG2 PWA37_005213 [Arxiozyma heterogenica]|uniref:histone acetyltransferase YNG2 n=1 Tax=Arxiozyma heterogenica TaxID=278026 RepID=UPI002F22563E
MDPSSALDEAVQDISNLEAEFAYILEEIRIHDLEIYEIKEKYKQKESILQKHLKQNGSLTTYVKEDSINKELKDSIEEAKKIQYEKCILANTALFMVSRHLNKLENNINILEEDGLLAPLEDEVESGAELSRENSVLSIGTEKKKRAIPSSTSTSGSTMKRKKHKRSTSVNKSSDLQKQNIRKGTVSPTPLGSTELDAETQKYNDELFSGAADNEEEDKTLYCFCQSVSYGEMVACDGPHCKYEWFHYPCVNLKEPPTGKWYCPDCKQEMLKNKTLKKRKS